MYWIDYNNELSKTTDIFLFVAVYFLTKETVFKHCIYHFAHLTYYYYYYY